MVFFTKGYCYRVVLPGLFFICISAMLAVAFGKELTWDLLSYHYYTPYALFHHRFGMDYFPPVSVQQYYNPIMDFLTYFLINHLSPIGVKLTMGALHGLNYWLIFLINVLVLHQYDSSRRAIFIAFLLSLLSLTGASALSEMGLFVGDATLSIFVLSSIFFLLYAMKNAVHVTHYMTHFIIASGAFYGMSLGLKLTSVIYFPGFFVIFLFLPTSLSVRCRQFFSWSMAVLIAYLCIASFWMYFLWVRFHNPFYPLFNGIFHASGFPLINLANNYYFPKGVLHTLLSPFYFSWYGNEVWPARDLSELYVFVLFILAIPVWLKTYVKDKVMTQSLFLFFIVSYVTWVHTFSIVRYQISLEMLSPLLVYLLCRLIAHHTTYYKFILYLLMIFLLSFSLMMLTAHSAHMQFFSIYSMVLMGLIATGLAIFAPSYRVWSLFLLIYFTVYATISYPVSANVSVYGKQYFEVHMPAKTNVTPRAMIIGLVPNFLQCDDIRLALPTSQQIEAPLPAYFTPTHAVMPGYLIPFFPRHWQFTGVYVSFHFCAQKNNVVSRGWHANQLPNDAKKNIAICESYTVTSPILNRIAQYNGPIFLLTTQSNVNSFQVFASKMGLQVNGSCQAIQTIVSQIDRETVLLCPVKKIYK